MRRIRYAVAASLDGYIAGPKGEADWIVKDPEIDFRALFAQFDTFLIGRRTYETMPRGGGVSGFKVLVFSRTLRQEDHPEVTIVAGDEKKALNALRKQPGKDIWLFGGGGLFRSLLDAGLVDRVEVAIEPVLLGGGIPLVLPPARRAKLKLTGHRVYSASGIVSLQYDVVRRR
ncbi:MAG: dihydrofolate reductase family protein [Thermoanaerobaculia bacterium]